MRCRVTASLLLVLLTGSCHGVAEAAKKPHQVQDLQYGEVLFHFYNDDYFTAITHLMAARDQNQLTHHAAESELLLGGLELSYGMYNEAEKQFLSSLDNSVDNNVRNRIWYYLGKIAYQRGRPEEALGFLQKFEQARDKELNAQYALLLANTEMALGNDKGAAERLKNPSAPQGIEEYLRINRGIALLRLGKVEEGRQALDELGKTQTDDEELRALRDRANLGLGYELLRAKQPDTALTYLNRVRLAGPFAQAALLGAGWADAARGDFENALAPWLELAGRDSHDTAVQEAQLAVPFAFEKLQDHSRAIHFYEKAIDYFDAEQVTLEAARRAVQTDMLKSIVSQLPKDASGGWLQRNKELEGLPGTAYLIEVLTGNPFQEHLKNYRDLSFLVDRLERWKESLESLEDIVDSRRQAYEEHAPHIRERLAKNEVGGLEARLKDYQQEMRGLDARRDPTDLASTKERSQWTKLVNVQNLLAKRGDDTHAAQAADKARWLQGVLYWQIQSGYAERLWKVKKTLRDLREPVAEARFRHNRVDTALRNAEYGFAGYDKRIAALQARLLALIPSMERALDETGTVLKRLALAALDQRMARLVSYRNQARYALARNYDQLAQQREPRQ